MKPADGLCSPGAQSSSSYINVTLASESSETVTFSAVPLKEGEIPIVVQLYDRDFDLGVDAIQKTLLVMVSGGGGLLNKTIRIEIENETVPTELS